MRDYIILYSISNSDTQWYIVMNLTYICSSFYGFICKHICSMLNYSLYMCI